MRVSRFLLAAGLAVLVAVTSMSVLSAQAKTDEDYDKLMKAVGAANGALRGAAMKHADAVAKATDPAAAMGAMKELGGTCMTCHTKYREKTESGFVIKKG